MGTITESIRDEETKTRYLNNVPRLVTYSLAKADRDPLYICSPEGSQKLQHNNGNMTSPQLAPFEALNTLWWSPYSCAKWWHQAWGSAAPTQGWLTLTVLFGALEGSLITDCLPCVKHYIKFFKVSHLKPFEFCF